jgi:nitrogen PTS system EIIA component
MEDLAGLFARGGISYNLNGINPEEILRDMVSVASLPSGLNHDKFLEAVLRRETMMTTAMGHGLALPHPRDPMAASSEDQRVCIGYLQKAMPWRALDGQPVHTLILIVSASQREHLQILGRTSFLCQQESFKSLLENRASLEDICAAVRDAEGAW